jgi:hypothetical protein
MIVHSKCQSKVAQFCGTRQIAVKMYEEWKEQNKSPSIETYILPEECETVEMEEKNRKLLINIYGRLQEEREHNNAVQDLYAIVKPYEPSDSLNQT